MEIKERLIELRKINGISQRELARQTGITQAAISLWEKGTQQPNADSIQRICNFFDISTDYFLGHSEDYGNIQYSEQKEELTPSERELLEMYRGLSPEGKGTAKTLVKSVKEYEVAQQRKNGVKMG